MTTTQLEKVFAEIKRIAKYDYYDAIAYAETIFSKEDGWEKRNWVNQIVNRPIIRVVFFEKNRTSIIIDWSKQEVEVYKTTSQKNYHKITSLIIAWQLNSVIDEEIELPFLIKKYSLSYDEESIKSIYYYFLGKKPYELKNKYVESVDELFKNTVAFKRTFTEYDDIQDMGEWFSIYGDDNKIIKEFLDMGYDILKSKNKVILILQD